MRTIRSPIWWVVYRGVIPAAAFPTRDEAWDWATLNGRDKFSKIIAARVTFRKTARQRDKSRYGAYLHADSGLSFIEWLKTRRRFYD